MTTLNGIAAITRMSNFRTYAPGKCLEAVDRAFQKPQSDRPGFYTYALRAAQTVPVNHRFDRAHLRAGMVIFLSAGANGYGHICIATDNKGGVISTDVPTGKIGRTTIDALCARWGRKFLYGADWLMGYQITNLGPAVAHTSVGSQVGRPTLRKGSKGGNVSALQSILNKYHGAKLRVDGVYGDATVKAVKAAQKTGKLSSDGIVGPLTWKMLGQ